MNGMFAARFVTKPIAIDAASMMSEDTKSHAQTKPKNIGVNDWRMRVSKTTKIAWCDSTCNPNMGCPGCELWSPKKGGTCYAASLVARYGGLKKDGTPANKGYPLAFDKPQAWPDRLLEAAKWPDLRGKERKEGKRHLDGMARHIFLSDMGDMFGPDLGASVPGLRDGQVWIDHIHESLIDVPKSDAGSRHVWLVLTKRPTKLVQFVETVVKDLGIAWPRNVYCGVSVTEEATAKRISILAEIREHVPVLFASLEPMVTSIDCRHLSAEVLDWVIVGGESGRGGRRMNPEWVRAIRDHCAALKLPFFFKQWGNWGPPGISDYQQRGGIDNNILDGQQHLAMPRASYEGKEVPDDRD